MMWCHSPIHRCLISVYIASTRKNEKGLRKAQALEITSAVEVNRILRPTDYELIVCISTYSGRKDNWSPASPSADQQADNQLT